jgi:outer membrane protein TolC
VPPEPAGYAALAAEAAAHNPRLTAYEPRVAATEHGERLARLSGLPRISLGLEWTGMPDPPKVRPERPRVRPLDAAVGTPAAMAPDPAMADSGDDEWMLNIGVTLPVWRRRVRAAVEEARLTGSALRHEARAERLMVEGDLGEAWFRYEDAKRRYRLYSESMIPLAYQTYESLQSRYATSSDGVEFLDLLESVRMLLEFQLAQLEAEKDWQAAAATLERIAGGHLPAAALMPVEPGPDAALE